MFGAGCVDCSKVGGAMLHVADSYGLQLTFI